MGGETIATLVASAVAFLTWSHQQRQKALDGKFQYCKDKIQGVEDRLNNLPLQYVLKVDLDAQIEDMRTRLRDINDKLDQLLLKR